MKASFITFLAHLAVPKLINLVATPLLLFYLFKIKNGPINIAAVPRELIRDKRDAALAAAVLTATVAAMVVNDLAALAGHPHIAEIGYIPFVAASFFASSPRDLVSRVDWGTVLFFIAMFIAMDAIWRGGGLQPIIHAALSHYDGETYFQSLRCL